MLDERRMGLICSVYCTTPAFNLPELKLIRSLALAEEDTSTHST